jgi:flagellar hook assembly protein FlgD
MVSVYDVTGRKVRQLSESLMQNGRIELYWDGRDDEGILLSPGNYIVQSEIHSDRGVDRQTSNLIIAY